MPFGRKTTCPSCHQEVMPQYELSWRWLIAITLGGGFVGAVFILVADHLQLPEYCHIIIYCVVGAAIGVLVNQPKMRRFLCPECKSKFD